MLGFALISEWPFDWAFFSGVYWGHQNVYFTLLLGLLAMKALDTSQTPEGMPALKGILGAAAASSRRRCSIVTTTCWGWPSSLPST